MSIRNLDKNSFVKRLNETVSPSRPIDSIEHLQGRHRELKELERALAIDGRHVFIYGDRGVGKSSLAATLAAQLQSADAIPVSVSGSPTESFASVVTNIVTKLTGVSRTHHRETTKELTGQVGAGLSVGSKQAEKSIEREIQKEVLSIAAANELLAEAVKQYAEDTIVVIDEFDRIGDKTERNKFADLLKHIGDSRTPVRLIFTGIGGSLEELLGAHGSAIRQLHTKELERLSYDGRWDIARQAASAFDLELPRDIEIRIAAISDGYPYYVHLMMEKMLWRAFDEEELVTKFNTSLYVGGLEDAISSISAELRRPYELVLHQATRDYEPVLWATADGDELYSTMHHYLGSYKSVMKQLNEEAMSDSAFRYRIKKLRDEKLGPILKKDPYLKRNFMYVENMLRGYVRMQAEAHGIRLYGREAKVKPEPMHVPAKVSTGFRGPTVPPGVRFRGEKGKGK